MSPTDLLFPEHSHPYRFETPADQAGERVKLWQAELELPTYELPAADPNPLFFEKRVYQGSSGKVYPLPFHDTVSDVLGSHKWQAVFLENDFVRLVMLSELGGRIQLAQDKTNGDYDFFYRNDVIKPALVGLAGPWISGGVEFNWPQHHRPGTYNPTQVSFEARIDGTKVAWFSENDPMNRLKGMVGISLSPNSSTITAEARIYNRTPHTQSFHWWANVAAEVHDEYQSFFPPDVNYVADHAARAMTEFPLSKGRYYGIDYAPGTDISWYKNIPVPTSYMVMKTDYDFFGGYDHRMGGGFVHVADHHVAPGKKQWTWGNAAFGRMWDHHLTDRNGPYIELMAGVYTNNQPDFTWMQPWETKTFTQSWYPIKGIGPASNATMRAALAFHALRGADGRITGAELGISASENIIGGEIAIMRKVDSTYLARRPCTTAPGSPWKGSLILSTTMAHLEELRVEFRDAAGALVVGYNPSEPRPVEKLPPAARAVPEPDQIASQDELYLAGEHLLQYRHPTRSPERWWEAALERDPGDSRCNLALATWRLRRGEFVLALPFAERAIDRLTDRHPNPETGEAHYRLGQIKLGLDDRIGAQAAFSKAVWAFAWRASGHFQLARLALLDGDLALAEKHLLQSLRHDSENTAALTLQGVLLRLQGREEPARSRFREILALDPLCLAAHYELRTEDGGAALRRHLSTDPLLAIDVAFEYYHCGIWEDGDRILSDFGQSNHPMVWYSMAWAARKRGDESAARGYQNRARSCSLTRIFPSGDEACMVLETAAAADPTDWQSRYLLGNLLYDRKRHADATAIWEAARALRGDFPTLLRNLGIARWNHSQDRGSALNLYEKAFAADPEDARIFFELDQLRKRCGIPIAERLASLNRFPRLVSRRDDLSLEHCSLLVMSGHPSEALEILGSHTFHPWEGGEGQVLTQWLLANLLKAKTALAAGDPSAALAAADRVLDPPINLGETWHPLQNQAAVHFYRGLALRELGKEEAALSAFRLASESGGDFKDMAVVAYSEASYFQSLALKALGEISLSKKLLQGLAEWVMARRGETATIDYFATSLPRLLVFEDDLQERHQIDCDWLAALAAHGLGNRQQYIELRERVEKADPAHIGFLLVPEAFR